MTRAALLQPPITQEAAEILARAFSPRPGATLISIVVDEQRRRIEMTFRYNGQIAKCVAVLEKRAN